jgi:hypothetical protein
VPGAWTRPADVRVTLQRRWKSGALLTAFATGQEWQPVGVPLRGPAARELGERLGEAQAWAQEWERAARGPLRIEYATVGGRHVGVNTIPRRAWVDGYEQAWALLGVHAEVRRLAELAELTGRACPRLVPWVAGHAMRALSLAAQWESLLETVRWIDEQQAPGMYLRQVDVPGVDTKFIERHRGILTELLDLQLDASRVDESAADFERRYRFRRKPGYVRFRSAAIPGWSELTVRADEFTVAPPGISRAYVLENEITYLAFPLPDAAMAILGGGYAVPALEALHWLAELDVIYWGDIDTHGLAILNRLRHRFPHVQSMLMDEATLLAHREQWVTEPSPSTAVLELLDPAEALVYRDLVTDRLGPSIRLEQERVSFRAIERALAASSPA